MDNPQVLIAPSLERGSRGFLRRSERPIGPIKDQRRDDAYLVLESGGTSRPNRAARDDPSIHAHVVLASRREASTDACLHCGGCFGCQACHRLTESGFAYGGPSRATYRSRSVTITGYRRRQGRAGWPGRHGAGGPPRITGGRQHLPAPGRAGQHGGYRRAAEGQVSVDLVSDSEVAGSSSAPSAPSVSPAQMQMQEALHA
jgi:hypothetical protein